MYSIAFISAEFTKLNFVMISLIDENIESQILNNIHSRKSGGFFPFHTPHKVAANWVALKDHYNVDIDE